ncbi:hypothetical protein [Veillonella rodentium]|uniref:Restriction endonuclease type IV Mrr domain-containing protein n=1 Tax=Veillonella rodentium TaxID=248315 RepID=A0A239YAJ2_9FIRM|nr:hypothetical protein [Veillonella rodentium]SNV56271.1 Uncharacterised protein [Veillonella rodentium]
MRKGPARGALLEIVLAKLIEVNGYEIIRNEDGREIEKRNNNLNIKGRGGYHQFDTLGRFKITPPFVYPFRLFVEAKFYAENPVGIDKVRMGVGILEDVNTNYSTVDLDDDQLSIERYHYHYAIFSTTGFSEPAQRFALAHRIHLVDLSGKEYCLIRASIYNIVEYFSVNGIEDKVREEFLEFKKWIDQAFENTLLNANINFNNDIKLTTMIETLFKRIENKVMYLATINSPFIVPLLSNDLFNELLKRNPHQTVGIKWHDDEPDKWIIVTEATQSNNDISISFTLSNLLRDYLLSSDNINDIARDIKEKRIGTFVFLAYLDKINPTLCTLKFNWDMTRKTVLK